MRKISDFISKPLISLAAANCEGTIIGFLCGKKLKSVDYFTVLSEGDGNDEIRLVATRYIKGVTDSAVTVATANSIKDLSEVDTSRYVENPLNANVFTTGGEMVGKLSDVYISDGGRDTVQIEAGDKVYPIAEIATLSPDVMVLYCGDEKKIRSAPPRKIKKAGENVKVEMFDGLSGKTGQKVKKERSDDTQALGTDTDAPLDIFFGLEPDDFWEAEDENDEEGKIETESEIECENLAEQAESAKTNETKQQLESVKANETEQETVVGTKANEIINEQINDAPSAKDIENDAQQLKSEQDKIPSSKKIEISKEGPQVRTVEDSDGIEAVHKRAVSVKRDYIINEADDEDNAAPLPKEFKGATARIITGGKLPQKLISDYSFLLGRVVTANIYNMRKELVIKKQTLVTVDTVIRARKAGKLLELTLNSRV